MISTYDWMLTLRQTKYSNKEFLEQAFHTAKIILSRFHYACNGSVPLVLDWKASQVSSMAKLGPKEVESMQRIRKEFKKRGTFRMSDSSSNLKHGDTDLFRYRT